MNPFNFLNYFTTDYIKNINGSTKLLISSFFLFFILLLSFRTAQLNPN